MISPAMAEINYLDYNKIEKVKENQYVFRHRTETKGVRVILDINE